MHLIFLSIPCTNQPPQKSLLFQESGQDDTARIKWITLKRADNLPLRKPPEQFGRRSGMRNDNKKNKQFPFLLKMSNPLERHCESNSFDGMAQWLERWYGLCRFYPNYTSCCNCLGTIIPPYFFICLAIYKDGF